jgi:hypothetical protein
MNVTKLTLKAFLLHIFRRHTLHDMVARLLGRLEGMT